MYRWITIALLASPSSVLASDSARVAGLSEQLDLHIAAGDAAAAAAYYCEQFVLVSGSGRHKYKSDMLADVANRALSFEINRTAQVSVRASEHTAVLIGVLHQKGQLGTQAFEQRLRVTDTWIRQGKHGWCLFAAHATVIADRTPMDKDH